MEMEAALNEVKRANESKNRFLAHMSHDIRTPINGILGILQLVENNDLSPDTILEYKEKVKSQAEHLLTMLTDVLDITRLDSDDIEIEITDLDFYSIKDQFDVYIEKTNSNITMDYSQFSHPFRRGCESYMRQIVLKLISNAMKFNRGDNPIELTLKEVADSDRILFTVRDHGIGISDEFREHIFESFSQENGDARTTYEGSGVGLTYVKRMVEVLHGSIDFVSKKDYGTIFRVELPLEIDYEKEKRQADPVENINLEGKKGLIVEDNEINMLIAECFLDRAMMKSDKAMNGKIGLDMFKESKEGEYDFILMDVMMPVMNGLEATRAIRECNHPQARTIPIIGISANYFPEDIKRGMDAGMNHYLSKPINRRMLIEAIYRFTKD